MNLRLHLLSKLNYDSTLRSLPVVLEISSDSAVEVSTKIDLLKVSLQHMSLSNVEFGHSSHGAIGILRNMMKISPQSPHFKLVDALEHDDAPLQSGEYQLKVAVRVYVRDNSQLTPLELEASEHVTVR
jgi:hypothetical protein